MPVLPEAITGGVTLGHVTHSIELNRRYNRTSAGVTSVYSPWDYGAVGDGVVVDQAAIQDAIDDCYAAGGGSVGPLGLHKMDDELILPDRVHLFGSGIGNSFLNWPVDLGLGKCAVRPPPGAALIGPFAPSIRDLSFNGPNLNTLGVRGVNMDGVRLGQQAAMTNVGIYGFGSGLVIGWDHNRLDHLDIRANYYGILFDSIHDGVSQHGTAGNHTFLHCVMVDNNFASVALHVNNVMDQTTWVGCHFGFKGHAIYRANFGATATNFFAGLMASTFQSCTFEYIGNSIYRDAGTGTAGTGTVSLGNTRFLSCTFTTTNAGVYRIPGEPYDYAFDLLVATDSDWWNGSQSLTVPQGGKGILRCGATDESMRFHIIPPAPVGAVGLCPLSTWTYGDSEGTARVASSTIVVGDVLAWTGANTVGRMTAATVDKFAGLAWNDANTSADNTTVVVIPPGGTGMANCEVITVGTKLYPVAGAEHHLGPTVNGTALARGHYAGGSAGGGAQVKVRLLGV